MAKETREVYRGKAVIKSVEFVGVDDWKEWERRDLSEIDKTNAFKIVYEVGEGDGSGATHEIQIEVSHRELRGKMLDYYKHEDGTTPTQIDVAIRSLVQQGLMERGADAETGVMAAVDDSIVGREVTIRAYEELGNDGAKWWPRCAFCARTQRISGADKAARLAAFFGGKPAPKVTTATTTAAMPSAPAEDNDDMPF